MRYAIERNSAEQELAAEKNLLRALLETLPDRIYFKDLRRAGSSVSIAAHGSASSICPGRRTPVGKTISISSCRSMPGRRGGREEEIMRTGQPIIEQGREGDASRRPHQWR